LIDQDAFGTDYFCKELRNDDFDVKWITKAGETMESIASYNPDILIMEMMMPIPDKWNHAEHIIADLGLKTGQVLLDFYIRKKYSRLPIINYTSARVGLENRYCKYIQKPELTSVIINTVRLMLKEKYRRDKLNRVIK
jgi:CheY-like chemotaxis protein